MQSPFTATDTIGAAARSGISVLHCIPTLRVGGAETQVRLLAPRLVALGMGVGIVARLKDPDVEVLSSAGVTCFPIRAAGNHNPAMFLEVLNAVRAARPSVVQTWLPQMDIVGGVVALGCRLPWILSERSSPPCYSATAKNWLRRRLGRSATLVANAPQGLDVWPGHADAQVIGNGIDLSAVDAVPKGLLRDHAPFRDRTSVVTISRLVQGKRIETLIAAIDIARGTVPDIRLIIVGDGPERAQLEARVAGRGLGDHVAFAGFQKAPVEWARSADMFVSASLFEGHPNAVTEAAASGVPMVLSDIPMHRSLMGDAARYAPPEDAPAFAAQIVALARDSSARETVVAAARRAVDRFDIDAIAARYASLYVRLASGRSEAPSGQAQDRDDDDDRFHGKPKPRVSARVP